MPLNSISYASRGQLWVSKAAILNCRIYLNHLNNKQKPVLEDKVHFNYLHSI